MGRAQHRRLEDGGNCRIPCAGFVSLCRVLARPRLRAAVEGCRGVPGDNGGNRTRAWDDVPAGGRAIGSTRPYEQSFSHFCRGTGSGRISPEDATGVCAFRCRDAFEGRSRSVECPGGNGGPADRD